MLQCCHLIGTLAYAFLAVLVAVQNPRSLLNRTCFFLFLCFGVWTFSLIFVHDPSATRQTAALFYSVGSFGWASFGSLALWFSLSFAKKLEILRSGYIYPVLVVPPAIVIYAQWAGYIAADYALYSWGWGFIWAESAWAYFFYAYYITYMGLAVGLLVQRGRQTEEPFERKQISIISYTALVSLVLATLVDVVLPRLDIHTIPNIAPDVVIVWAVGLAVTIARYRLLEISPEVAATSIVTTMSESLFLLDPEGTIILVNPSAVALFGYSEEELTGRSFDQLFPDPPAGPGETVINAVNDGGRRDYLMEGRDARRIPVSLSISTLRSATDAIVGTVCVARDITDRKKAEDALRRAHDDLEERVTERTAALRASEERFRMIFDGANDGILLADMNSQKLHDANPAFCRMLGYSLPEIESLRVEDIHPEHDGVFQSLETTGEQPLSVDVPVRRKDGSVLYADIHSTSIALLGVDYWLGVFRDVTQRRALEGRLREAQRMEAVGQLAGGVAHDLNNLLTVIMSYSQLAMAGCSDDSEALEDLREVVNGTKKAARLVEHLLAFGRRQIQELEALDTNQLVEKASGILRPVLGEDVELVAMLPGDIWRVDADRGQLEQVILNLALNARDAMPSGGRLTIETANTILDEEFARTHPEVRPGEYMRLLVSDTGCGMSAETLSRAFEPFYTTKEMGKGTGLGLSSVFGIVKQSQGHISIESVPDRGTTVSVYLRRAESERLSAPVVSTETVDWRGRETILLVEDDGPLRNATKRILASMGYHILDAEDGVHALSICEAHAEPIDLMFTDVVMPGMSGKKLAEKATVLHPEMLVVFMSGYPDDVLGRHGALEPGIAMIKKPYDKGTVLRKIREILDAKAERRGASA